eukprot:scaffold34602_cov216-Amphora_coffeaeformis.AAC.5
MSYYANPYDVMDPPNEYPLHFAARKGQYDSVRKLLKERFDPNTLNIYGLSPLHLACQNGFVPIVKLLLDHQADKFKQEPCGPTPFQMAISKGNLNVLQLLLEGEHVDVRDRGHTALHWAVAGKCPLLVAWLLQQKADPNARVGDTGKTPVHLLRGVVGTFRESSSALAVLRILAKYGADLSLVDAEGKMAIHGQYNDPELVKTLVSLGVDVNAVDAEGKTALYYSCGPGGSFELVQWLLDHGARTEMPDLLGITPLSYAVRQGEREITLRLFQHRANATTVDHAGRNPLHALLESRIPDKEVEALYFMRNIFLPGNGDVNARTNHGWTALHYAVFYNLFEIVKFLLLNGATVQCRTLKGQTPLHMVGLKNYDIGMRQEEERIQQALNVEILRKTEKLPRLPWDTSEEPEQNSDSQDDEDSDDVDDNSVVSNHGLPWKVRNRAVYRLLLKRGADCTAVDQDGNLPFFLAASTEWLDAIFPLLRMAARQGIFENKNQRMPAAKESEESGEPFPTVITVKTLRKKRRLFGI